MLILAVDDEPDAESLFRQQFRRDFRRSEFCAISPHGASAHD